MRLRVLRCASTLPALQAVRDLAEQLQHLDQTRVAAPTVKGRGTEHLFRERLRQTPDWPALGGFAAAVTGSWRDALRGAGYELEELPRGYLARCDGAPVAVMHPIARGASLSTMPQTLFSHPKATLASAWGLLSALLSWLFDADAQCLTS
jgi:hypothetical protein